MKYSIFIVIFIFSNISFGYSRKFDFFIILDKCTKFVTPKKNLSPIVNNQIFFSNDKILSCDRFDKIYFCFLSDGGNYFEKSFFKAKKSHNITEAFESSKKDEVVLVKNREVLYQKYSDQVDSFELEQCKGLYYDDNLKSKTKVFDADLGLKNIFNDLKELEK